MNILEKVNNYYRIFSNMGTRYVTYRSWFELAKKTGLLKQKFPASPEFQQFITLKEWKKLPAQFFFASRETITFPKSPTKKLKEKIERLRAGELSFFNAAYKNIGINYDWLTNPNNNFQYKNNIHWLDIDDFSAEAGDIKFVWEKSRFSYLHTIIRYDYHFGEDCAEWVFSEIDSWIVANPINCGPNYKCSQEISLRLLNWLYALYYYKNSPVLTEERFEKIMHYCYWQLHHVRQNINFSRIAVRNNHAITETMMLYLGGIFFPFFPAAKKWSEEGLKWLEQEVEYQVYEDGTFLQFSHNYHRVLVQLLTWSLYLSELNGYKLSNTFIERAQRTVQYLYQCQMEENGYLPNYGANDGALFFPLNDCAYRDYRPQLNALAYYFNRTDLYAQGDWTEDRRWYTASFNLSTTANFSYSFERTAIAAFPEGGYYTNRDKETLTFIRCGKHKDRPSHADNLHLDIWWKGKNMLRDAGTYKYNTNTTTLSFFVGTKGHNTIMLGDNDQMKKGARFIWLNWTQAVDAHIEETNNGVSFSGRIQAFQHIASNIIHQRSWLKTPNKAEWSIEDTVEHNTGLPIQQIWNIHPDFEQYFTISAKDSNGQNIPIQIANHWYSGEYGIKEPAKALIFTTKGKTISTSISIK